MPLPTKAQTERNVEPETVVRHPMSDNALRSNDQSVSKRW